MNLYTLSVIIRCNTAVVSLLSAATNLENKTDRRDRIAWEYRNLLLLLFIAIEFSLGGGSPYTSNK
jgi:hypothetical protein